MTAVASPRTIVEDIVRSRLPVGGLGYQPIVDEVVAALEARDASIVTDLRRIAREQSLNPVLVTEALLEIGLEDPVEQEPEPPAVNGSGRTLEDRVAALEHIARTLGYMGRPVGD